MKKYQAPNYDYEQYVATQKHRSESKWGTQTFDTITFLKIVNNLMPNFKGVHTIGCMGIRNGNEYKEFKDIPQFKSAEIIGVDICEKVKELGADCYCYDFSQLPEEWENKFDLLYSNSLDHAFDVDETINEWYRVTKGYMIIDLSTNATPDASDIYKFQESDVDQMFDSRFKILKVWHEPNQTKNFNVFLEVIK